MNDSDLAANSAPAIDLVLAPSRIDIWYVPINAAQQIVEGLTQPLSDDERERAIRFHTEANKNLFIAARGILRTILSSYISVQPEHLIFENAPKGKPRLKNHAGLHFNLGHSGGRAIYAVAGNDVGVDIELIKDLPDWKTICRRFFSQREAGELIALEPSQQIAGFFACWTRKEAYLKATGEGIAAGLDKFYAGTNPAKTSGPIEEDGRPQQWYFKDLEVGDEYATAVVSRSEHSLVRRFDFQQAEDCLRFILENKRKQSL